MRILLSLFALLALYAGVHAQPSHSDSPCNQGHEVTDPRNYDVICLPEVARVQVTTSCEYGRNIYAIGDVNHDSLADWIVGQVRCDTLHPTKGNPEEILLYKGVRGGLPAVGSGERIGPTEVLSSTQFLASGDWDGDGNMDIACQIRIYGDTTGGNYPGGFDTRRVVVFWGNPTGSFTIDDTSHLLSYIGSELWLAATAVSADFNSDGVADLYVLGGGSFLAGQVIQTPDLHIYLGHLGKRWGRESIDRSDNWHCWNRPPQGELYALDQNGDGVIDIAMIANPSSAGTGYVSVLYGKVGSLPDSTDFEGVDLYIPNGKYSLFEDVTGDGIPELLVHTGVTDERVKIYLGLKGQRLIQQFGSGDDPAHPGKPQWWGKPWAEIWLPNRIQPAWSRAHNVLFGLGDGNRDGIGDIWAYSWPFLLCYSGGEYLDSLIDGMLDTEPAGGPGASARLGDIDGSGAATLAFETESGIIYFKASRDVPHEGVIREIPRGTGPAGVESDHRVVVGRPRLSNVTPIVMQEAGQ